MSDLGVAYIQVLPSADGISEKISDSIGGDKIGNETGEKISKGIGDTLKSKGKTLMKTGAVMTGVAAGFIGVGSKLLAMSETQANAELKLTEIYKTRMGATDAAAKSTMELASALQQQGVVGDEVTLSGAQQLATFAKYPDTVNKLLPAMDNLLVQQKGYNATAEDATGVANLMGKVLNGQTGALTRVGISFTDAQEQVLKYGGESEKAAMLSEVITQNVGNMNAEFAKTDAGKIQQAKNTLGDLGEQLGAALLPALAKIAQFVSAKILPAMQNVINFITSHPIIGGIMVGITTVLAVAGPLLIFIGSLVTAIGTITAAVSAAQIALAPTILIVLAIAAAIAAAIAIGVLLYKNWDKIKAKGSQVFDAIKTKIAAFVTAVKSFFHKLAQGIKAVFERIKAIAAVVWQGILMAIKIRLIPIKLAILGIKTVISGVRSAFNKIKSAMTHPISSAASLIRGTINRIRGMFPLSVGRIFSNLKVPKISISGGKAPWGIGGEGTKPNIKVHWAAKGAIVNQATLLGAGEAGSEAILPLDPFWNKLSNGFQAIQNTVGAMTAQSQAGGTLTVIMQLDGKTIGQSTVEYINGQTIQFGTNPLSI